MEPEHRRQQARQRPSRVCSILKPDDNGEPLRISTQRPTPSPPPKHPHGRERADLGAWTEPRAGSLERARAPTGFTDNY